MTLPEKFDIYHASNPHVYELFKKYALEVKNTGKDKFSSKAIFERLRWHYAVETKGDEYKLNNNYTSFYARKLMNEDKRFDGFFYTRDVKR